MTQSLARPPAFVLLGRYGDLIQIFPCLLAIYQRTGAKPVVIVSRDYASLFDGISYAEPYVVQDHWWKGVGKARQIAEHVFGNVVVPQWWHDDPEHNKMVKKAAEGCFVLQCHAIDWGVNIKEWPDYGTSMASRCGFTREEWVKLPLVFDRRNPAREEALWNQLVQGENRPVVLYNFVGASSPFAPSPEVNRAMRNAFGPAFRFVDLGRVHAARIYDLVGLYDRAVGLLTSDTATLHLAPASRIPYIAFTVDNWSQSVPKGNCVLHIKYSQVLLKLQDIVNAVAKWRP